ncbi:MAG: Zn-dependent oligopeptidase [Cyclobacteriaceae bacterium]
MKINITLSIIALAFLSCQPAEKTTIESPNPILVQRNAEIPFGDITSSDIEDAFKASKESLSQSIEAIASINDKARTFDNTVLAYDDMIESMSRPFRIIYLMGSTHPDSLVRNTAVKIRSEYSKMYNEMTLNEDLYNSMKAYSQTEEVASLPSHKAKLVKEIITEFERNGFALGLEEREELKSILNDISTLSNQFSTNIANYKDFLIVTEEGMKGLTDDYKKAHLQEDGTYKIGLSYPDYRPFMKYAESSDLRKQLSLKYVNRAADSNLDVLDSILIKRQEMADLLGYRSFAAYQTETRMVKTPENAWAFEKSLKENVNPKAILDEKELLDFQTSLGIKKEKVDSWDRSFLLDKMKTANYGVDAEEIRQYFPIENVKDGLFSITQKLFGLTYEKVADASVWHPDVSAYDVKDENDEIIARFYLDLHPRPNKYGHAACFGLRGSKAYKDGSRSLPIATLVCNFTEPTEDKPALMTHGEVKTFFHEFGHVLHNILSKTELNAQSGTSVARDFVEAPSQIFENWVWNYESLSLFAKHYETNEVLPQALFDKMLAAKNVMSGTGTLGQVMLGTYDLSLHDGYQPSMERTTTDVLKEVQNEFTLSGYREGSHFQAAFGHLTGYAAGYYGYQWSKVYAEDMFSKFEEGGILNPEMGKAYRDKVLSRGSEVDEMEMLIDFLGREPNQDAFVKSIGL